MSVAFADIVTVLMRSPQHKHFSLADLEWLVVPPLRMGQCRVAKTLPQQGAPGIPIAAVLWASVSHEVDERLSGNVNAPMRLRPDEWKSGDVLWLVEAVGDPRIVPSLLKQLMDTALKGQTVKVRRLENGRPAVCSLAVGDCMSAGAEALLWKPSARSCAALERLAAIAPAQT